MFKLSHHLPGVAIMREFTNMDSRVNDRFTPSLRRGIVDYMIKDGDLPSRLRYYIEDKMTEDWSWKDIVD